MANKIEIVATFDDDTKRMHRFVIDEGQAVRGVIYVAKDAVIPDFVNVRLMTRAEAEAEKKGQG